MTSGRRNLDGRTAGWLLAGGVGSGIASLLHVGIIAGGPDWYRFFGAGERMARLAAAGSPYPGIITAGLATILAAWALYAFSGARVIRPLPLLRIALSLIAAAYLLRGLLGMPVVFLVDDPYTRQLRAKTIFMVVSSALCIVLGLCYVVGAVGMAKLERGARAAATNSAKCLGSAMPPRSLLRMVPTAVRCVSKAQPIREVAGTPKVATRR